MNKAFKQETFTLDLKRYLNLTKEKLWRSIVFSSITFVCFLGLIICMSILTVIFKDNSQINKLEMAIYIMIIPCLISLNFIIWWSKLLLSINKLIRNFEQAKDWSLRKKRKYFAIFVLVAKIHFSPNNIEEEIKTAKLNFQNYINSETIQGNYSFINPLEMEMWWVFFDEFIIFHFFLMIIYIVPMFWTQFKHRYQIGIFIIKDNENVKKNFSYITNNFLNTLGMNSN